MRLKLISALALSATLAWVGPAAADSFTLGLEGIAFVFDGGLDRGDLDLDLLLEVDDLILARALVPAVGE